MRSMIWVGSGRLGCLVDDYGQLLGSPTFLNRLAFRQSFSSKWSARNSHHAKMHAARPNIFCLYGRYLMRSIMVWGWEVEMTGRWLWGGIRATHTFLPLWALGKNLSAAYLTNNPKRHEDTLFSNGWSCDWIDDGLGIGGWESGCCDDAQQAWVVDDGAYVVYRKYLSWCRCCVSVWFLRSRLYVRLGNKVQNARLSLYSSLCVPSGRLLQVIWEGTWHAGPLSMW